MIWTFLFYIIFHILCIRAIKPILIPQIIVNDNEVGQIIRMKGYDLVGNKLVYSITRLPVYGKLYQLSHSYSNYGYNPIKGTQIVESNTNIVDVKHRVLYSSKYEKYSCSFLDKLEQITFNSYNGHQYSYENNITIVDKYGTIICSDFLLDNDQWTIVGNKQMVELPKYEPYSRGEQLNHYIYASENKINTDKYGDSDKSLWFFNAPSKFLGNMRMVYGGYIRFTIGIFAGDITKLNFGKRANLIELDCITCNRKEGKRGITVTFPLDSAMICSKIVNNIAIFEIPILETKGWLKDPHNTLLNWKSPSQCDFISVLTHLSGFRILGDITDWYETVAIDNVYITNTKYNIPNTIDNNCL